MDDVIVVGGGPAGAMSAIILARAGARVQLFDRTRFPRDKLCGDTLNPGALRLLAAHGLIEAIASRGRPLDGMILTGPGASVHGRYPNGLTGRSLSRRDLDAMLVAQAVAAGAQFDDRAFVTEPTRDAATGHVRGVVVRTPGGARVHDARLVIAADGRTSRLASALALRRVPPAPRRWAVGAYFEGVGGLTRSGEMHVRATHYLGVAPMPNGFANVCLVVPADGETCARWREPATMLRRALAGDAWLAPRFVDARLVDPPQVLGPMAVDVTAAGVPGLLLAGDAAGFIDPITGDGLSFALGGAVLAAAVAIDVLSGRVDPVAARPQLARLRRHAFSAKWRFNRTLRALVGWPAGVGASAAVARVLPAAFAAIIRYAGDCGEYDRLTRAPVRT